MASLRFYVVKIAERCNLNCSYCYIYNRGDNSWKQRPAIISEPVVKMLGQRINEHCKTHAIGDVVVCLHGGEPLLVGKSHMQTIVDTLRSNAPDVRIDLCLQTNGLLLDLEWVELFERNNIRVGISLDGPPHINDQFRVYHDGRGTTDELLEKLARLRSDGVDLDKIISGALCVINPATDGAEILRWFCRQGFRSLDFLLPDGNYANLPQGWHGPKQYLRFLIDAFDAWYKMGSDAPHIISFESIIKGFMGVRPELDALGGDLSRICVVESDGSVGAHDVLRICGNNFSHPTLNLFDHSLDRHGTIYQFDEIQKLSNQCKNCKHLKRCGGGYAPHRFDGVSFSNPSLYCEALYGFMDHIYDCLRRDVPDELWKKQAA